MTGTTETLRRTATGRPVAPGGWRRALVGIAVGAVLGGLVLLGRRPVGGR